MRGLMESRTSRKEGLPLSDIRADRLDALQNLAFLMRVDIDRQENLKEYLQYMDMILDGMTEDVGARRS